MRLRVIGCGDAFGSGGRANTCFWVECGDTVVTLDFGATSLVEIKRAGLDHRRIDTILLSHLHGDHFGGLPFLLLDCQFNLERERPLRIVGPVGTKDRLRAALDVLFPGSSENAWRFEIEVVDLPCRQPFRFGEFELETYEVVHPSGAPSTALRLRWRDKILAFSGDTSWSDALLHCAAGSNLFVVECFMPSGNPFGHGTLETIDANRARLGAERIMLTHMSSAMLARVFEAQERGFLVAHDGLVYDL